MSRFGSLRNKPVASPPNKPGRTAARLRDQKRKALTPKVRRLVSQYRQQVRTARAEAARQAKAVAP